MIAGEEWPSCWEAVSALTRSEIRVATVLRNVWGVTQSRPVSLRICRSVQEEAYAPDEGAFGACASAPNTVAQSFAMLTMVHPWRVATSVIGSGSAKVSAEPT